MLSMSNSDQVAATSWPLFLQIDIISQCNLCLLDRAEDQSTFVLQMVALTIKRYIAAVGADPSEFAGHSLRVGSLSSAAKAGADALRKMEVLRHHRVETLACYVRRGSLFRGHAGTTFL